MIMRGRGPFAGARMELPVSRTPTGCRTSRLHSGTARSKFENWRGITERNVNHGISDFLKERLFGLSNPQGNHGESVKEAHFHVDNTPTVGAFSTRGTQR